MKLPTSLTSDLKAQRVMLFAGAGVSAVLNLPSWAGLIAKMAGDLDFDPELFEMLGTYPSLAEYYLIRKPNRAVLAAWFQRKWHSASIDVSTSVVHGALVDAGFPIIYTTNYDHWIERAYDARGLAYCKIVYGEEIADAAKDRTQIVKFHGDLVHPETMVLTEADYFQRLRFETQLDLKLRSDLLQYSVIFIGYSLVDLNMRNMLYRLSLFRREQKLRRFVLQRSYIFMDRVNEVQANIFGSWGIDTINSEKLDRREALEEFMGSIASATK